MFGKKNEKLEALKDILGSKKEYMEAVQMLGLDKEEKDIFLRAFLEVKKKKPNMDIINKAYAILIGKSSQGQKNSSTHHATNDSSSESKMKKRFVLPSLSKKVIVSTVLVIVILYTWMVSDDSTYIYQNEERTKEVSSMNKFSKKLYNTVIIMLYKGNGVEFKNIGKEVFRLNSDDCFVVGENGETISNYNSYHKSKFVKLYPGESFSLPMKMSSLNQSKGDYLECSTNTMRLFRIHLMKDDNSDVIKKTSLDNLFLQDGKKITRKVSNRKFAFFYDKNNNEILIKNVGRSDFIPRAMECFIADKEGEPIRNYRPRMIGSRSICGPGASVALEYNSKILSSSGGDHLECISAGDTLFKVR